MNRIKPEDRVKVLDGNPVVPAVIARIGQEGIYKGEGMVVFDDGDYWYYMEEDLQLVAKAKALIVTPWYENIPEQGVLCWVDDYDETEKNWRVSIIKEWNPKLHLSFISNLKSNWKYATPVTKEEARKLIYEEQ